jgi:hypothetical protein
MSRSPCLVQTITFFKTREDLDQIFQPHWCLIFSLYVIWCHVNHRTPFQHSHQYPQQSQHVTILIFCGLRTRINWSSPVSSYRQHRAPSQPGQTSVDRQPPRLYHMMRHRPTRSFWDTVYIFLVSVVIHDRYGAAALSVQTNYLRTPLPFQTPHL